MRRPPPPGGVSHVASSCGRRASDEPTKHPKMFHCTQNRTLNPHYAKTSRITSFLSFINSNVQKHRFSSSIQVLMYQGPSISTCFFFFFFFCPHCSYTSDNATTQFGSEDLSSSRAPNKVHLLIPCSRDNKEPQQHNKKRIW